MINLRLAGGLGNQLFQLCCALNYCQNDISSLHVYMGDLGNYDVPREYELSKLLDFEPKLCNRLNSVVLKSRLPRLLNIPSIFINDKNYTLNKNRHAQIIYLDGYFQYEQGWNEVSDSIAFLRSKLRNDFVQKEASGLVIHARGGDFLQDSLSHDHQMKFYEHALTQSRLNDFSSGKLCCSDAQYADQIIKFFETKGIILSHREQIDSKWETDFKLLINAELIVGSRSTFAWWASLLGRVECMFPSDFNIGVKRKLYHPWEIKCV